MSGRTTWSRCSFRVSCYVYGYGVYPFLGNPTRIPWACEPAIEGPGGAGRSRGWPQPGHRIVGTVRGLGRNRARRYRRINNTGSRSYVKRPPCYARRYCHRRWVRSKEEGRGQDAVGTFYLQRRAPPYNVDAVQITSYLPGPLFRFDSIHFFLSPFFFSFFSFSSRNSETSRKRYKRHEMIHNFVKRRYT